MKPIYYKSSEGVIVNLITPPYRMLTETDLLNSEWEPTTVGENFPHITRLDKKLVSPKFKIRITGSTKTEMANNLEHIESVFDRDCFLNQMGRLYIGEFYRECFITGITHEKVFEKNHTVAEYVATSNDGYWVSNKEISFSGMGELTGEMADKVYVTSNFKSADIVYTPNDNHTAHLNYPSVSTQSSNLAWIKFDFGSVMSISEFSGLKYKRPNVPMPLSCEVQTSDGTTVDDTRTISATSGTPTGSIFVNDFETLVIDSTGLSTSGLIVIGYDENHQEIDRFFADVEEDVVDVSRFNSIKFVTLYAYDGEPSTVTYTVQEEQWTTETTLQPSINTEVEVELTDIECRYVRLKSQYFLNGFDEDLSVVSDEPSSPKNLIELGYQLDNLSYYRVSPTYRTFYTNDKSQVGYVIFDDEYFDLRKVETSEIFGGATLQGLDDGEWVDICDIESNMNSSFSQEYEKLRLKVDDAITYDGVFNIKVVVDAKITNDSYAPSNAIIEISGQQNPSVIIDDVEYGASVELLTGHTLVIDTKKHTVRDYADEYSYENVYASRFSETFTPIESGVNDVTWSGSAEIKITLEQARSTPKWN